MLYSTLIPTLFAAFSLATPVPDNSTASLISRGDPAGTGNIWKGRCNWNFHSDNAYNFGQLSKWVAHDGYLGWTKTQAANEILWCVNGGLCAWSNMAGVDGKVLRAAAKKLETSKCCGSCGIVALYGNNMNLGVLTYNYPSKCHDKQTGGRVDCNQFAIVDESSY